jgi:hypothetical protein
MPLECKPKVCLLGNQLLWYLETGCQCGEENCLLWPEEYALKLQFSCLYKLSNREEGKVSDMGLCLNEYGHGSFISIRNYFF